MKLVKKNTLIGLCALSVCAISSAASLKFGGPIDSAQSGVEGAPGVGYAILTLDTEANTFDLDINIQGQANDITMSHIHLGAPGETGGVAFDIGAKEDYAVVGTFYSRMIDDAAFPAANLVDLLAGNTYLNFHTAENPGGEVRGQLAPLAMASEGILNLSTRGIIDPSDGSESTLIGGLVLDAPQKILFRALGKTLSDSGVADPIDDVTIRVFSTGSTGQGNPVEIGQNDNWTSGGQEYAIAATRFAPGDDSESGVLLDLNVGTYHVHLASNSGKGVGLVETYGIENYPMGIALRNSATGDLSQRLTLLHTALAATGLDSVLNEPGPFTLFAPTDEAFLNVFTVEELTELLADDADKEEDLATLTGILLYHVVGANIPSSGIPAGTTDIAAMTGETITIVNDGGVTIQGAGLVEVDITTTNGVIHVIDAVILP